ncbi:hypothetical protein BO82DRAFT_395311 [Aspergillus uvarum CBS 121591]|uniref:Zn(2)-C6 fungal-type domain-containing protein n=1 Tax=Aspergillus uvarum CBS 121591 TaxID=1448315 RepID=A0A319BZD6_9EURO|nr:hypothetical protein BO82DRAFT_395311 [Aspergillus uvarum CBS 121591]PYH77491.1 hypothetical protein BO82DRAFT_395311 [Aspergillus uvarum CBS 121591]
MEQRTTLPNRKRGGARRKACNECKQHKIRCDSARPSTEPCSRCRRLQIECKIEPSFRRTMRRKRNAEMESEIAGLRQRLATGVADAGSQYSEEGNLGTASGLEVALSSQSSNPENTGLYGWTPLASLSERPSRASEADFWKLEDVSLSQRQVAELFEQSPLDYLRSCPLQAWTVICIASRRDASNPNFLNQLLGPFTRLMWATVNSIPQDYNVIKALCLLCTWPLPTTTQKADPTFVLSGIMMQLSMQSGLHRPVRAEEFTTLHISHGEAVRDRLQTWLVCNIVAQNVSTGYGQPSGTVYDWALGPSSLQDAEYFPSEDLLVRFRIEKFCDHVTRTVYNTRPEAADFISTEKLMIVQLLENELENMETELGRNISRINKTYLRGAELHLRCFVFLGTNARKEGFTKLFVAATAFLSQVLELETSGQIGHATNYILQMTVSAAFALLKILKSRIRHQIDFEYGKLLFNGAISALRRTSVMRRDRPDRLADVLAQMWNATDTASWPFDEEETPQLKIRCRMSMSHVFDTVWRWRHQFRAGMNANGVQCATAAKPNEEGGTRGGQSDGPLMDSLFMCPPQVNEGTAMPTDGDFSEIFDSLVLVFDDVPDAMVNPPLL